MGRRVIRSMADADRGPGSPSLTWRWRGADMRASACLTGAAVWAVWARITRRFAAIEQAARATTTSAGDDYVQVAVQSREVSPDAIQREQSRAPITRRGEPAARHRSTANSGGGGFLDDVAVSRVPRARSHLGATVAANRGSRRGSGTRRSPPPSRLRSLAARSSRDRATRACASTTRRCASRTSTPARAVGSRDDCA